MSARFLKSSAVDDRMFGESLLCAVAAASPSPLPASPPAPPRSPPEPSPRSSPPPALPPAPPPSEPAHLQSQPQLPPVRPTWALVIILPAALVACGMALACGVQRYYCEPRRHRLVHEHASREERLEQRHRGLLPPLADGGRPPSDGGGRGRRVRLPPPGFMARCAARHMARYMARHKTAVDERLVDLTSVTTAAAASAEDAMAVASGAALEAQDARGIVDALRYPTVERWTRHGLVHVGVALPDGCSFALPHDAAEDELAHEASEDDVFDVSTWDAVEAEAAPGGRADGPRAMRVQGLGSGFCVDARGVVLTDAHVRSLAQRYIGWASDAGFVGGCLVFAPSTMGNTDWSRGWEASVLAYTEDWNAQNARRPPDPHVRPLEGFAGPLSPTQRFADAALLCATRELASGARVSMQPGGELRIPRGAHQLDEGEPQDLAETLCAMPRDTAGPRLGELLWALGHPTQQGGSRAMATECRLANTTDDEHGEWLQLVGKILPGMSGGPIVNASAGAVVAWIVRESYETGTLHARHVGAAQPCIDAGLAALAGATRGTNETARDGMDCIDPPLPLTDEPPSCAEGTCHAASSGPL